jgi:hypothetical protein
MKAKLKLTYRSVHRMASVAPLSTKTNQSAWLKAGKLSCSGTQHQLKIKTNWRPRTHAKRERLLQSSACLSSTPAHHGRGEAAVTRGAVYSSYTSFMASDTRRFLILITRWSRRGVRRSGVVDGGAARGLSVRLGADSAGTTTPDCFLVAGVFPVHDSVRPGVERSSLLLSLRGLIGGRVALFDREDFCCVFSMMAPTTFLIPSAAVGKLPSTSSVWNRESLYSTQYVFVTTVADRGKLENSDSSPTKSCFRSSRIFAFLPRTSSTPAWMMYMASPGSPMLNSVLCAGKETRSSSDVRSSMNSGVQPEKTGILATTSRSSSTWTSLPIEGHRSFVTSRSTVSVPA